MNPLDKLLNRITMYRLVVYVLGILSAASVVFSFTGALSPSPTELVVSLALLITSAYLTDRGLARIFNVPTNRESALITALIIFLIVQPSDSVSTGLALVLGGAVSSLSKFILAWNAKHIFNPAAVAATLLTFSGLQPTTWWVGSSVLWPLTLVLGLAVVRKIRRGALWLTFIAVSTVLQLAVFMAHHEPIWSDLKQALIASPLLFLSTIMLTEPATMPPRRKLQMVFGSLVAVLYVFAWKLGPLTIYPEVALLIGNIFAFAVSPKFRLRLQLQEVQQISAQVYNYVFKPDRRFSFLPGQYMEWTLPGVAYDERGNRRTFTLASSPTEDTVQLGVKYYQPASTYKARLNSLQPGAIMYASQLSGNFTLNGNERGKLVFIAGGIGITPFRSMIKYLTDTAAVVDIVLLYAVANPEELAYMSDFAAAAAIGVRTIPIITDPAQAAPGTTSGRISSTMIQQLVPDYAERIFYLSGPNAMVDATKHHLHALNVPDTRIRTDHFSGY